MTLHKKGDILLNFILGTVLIVVSIAVMFCSNCTNTSKTMISLSCFLFANFLFFMITVETF
jgi:hypothetical protein